VEEGDEVVGDEAGSPDDFIGEEGHAGAVEVKGVDKHHLEASKRTQRPREKKLKKLMIRTRIQKEARYLV